MERQGSNYRWSGLRPRFTSDKISFATSGGIPKARTVSGDLPSGPLAAEQARSAGAGRSTNRQWVLDRWGDLLGDRVKELVAGERKDVGAVHVSSS
jgi:hypothetical protein